MGWGWSRGVRGLSDLLALSKICQGDVISLRPTMKVISQSKGISGKLWLLQRPGKLGPMTLFMCVRQTALSRRQLKWLRTPPHPINLPAYNPCALLTFLTPAISQKSKIEGSKRRDTRQIPHCKRVSVGGGRAHADTLPQRRGSQNFSQHTLIQKRNQKYVDTVNAHALLSAHVCEQVFAISARICVTL